MREAKIDEECGIYKRINLVKEYYRLNSNKNTYLEDRSDSFENFV